MSGVSVKVKEEQLETWDVGVLRVTTDLQHPMVSTIRRPDSRVKGARDYTIDHIVEAQSRLFTQSLRKALEQTLPKEEEQA